MENCKQNYNLPVSCLIANENKFNQYKRIVLKFIKMRHTEQTVFLGY